MNASSHNLDRLRIDFDARGLVANAGLVLPAMLTQHLGLPALLRHHVQLGRVAGAANPDVKAMTAIASQLAGGEWVDDVNAVQADGLGSEILGLRPAAGSTVGTFLRAFTVGHVRQLDAGSWATPPSPPPLSTFSQRLCDALAVAVGAHRRLSELLTGCVTAPPVSNGSSRLNLDRQAPD